MYWWSYERKFSNTPHKNGHLWCIVCVWLLNRESDSTAPRTLFFRFKLEVVYSKTRLPEVIDRGIWCTG